LDDACLPRHLNGEGHAGWRATKVAKAEFGCFWRARKVPEGWRATGWRATKVPEGGGPIDWRATKVPEGLSERLPWLQF
jgi:hypothetical protein